MIISNKAIRAIKKNNKLMGRLMICFDRGQKTINKWLETTDIRLTTPDAVRIIGEESGLSEEEILAVSEIDELSQI